MSSAFCRHPFGHCGAQEIETRVQISLFFFRFLTFFVFFFFRFLGPKCAQKGPGGLPKGPGMDYASFGPSFRPNGSILGPIGPLFLFEFPKNSCWAQIAPSPVWVQGPYGPQGPWRPKTNFSEAEGRLFGVVCVWGGAAASPQKRCPWSYCQ